MRGTIALGLLAVLIGCGESGPSEAEVAKLTSEKNCSKLYGALTKVLTEELHKGGVSGVELGEKGGFVTQCAAAGFTEEQVKCLDPNTGGTEACKKALEPMAEKTKALTEYLLAPMKKKMGAPEGGAAPEGAAPAAPEGGAPAGG